MNYFVQREQQEYGPYTEADLRRYLGSGHLSPDDRFRQEDSGGYRSLRESGFLSAGPSILSSIPPGAFLPAYQKPQMANGAPLPPDMHWALVFLLTVVTCGFFAVIWMLMQAWWLKQLREGNRSVWTLATSLGICYAGSLVLGIFAPVMEIASRGNEEVGMMFVALLGVSLLISLVGLCFFFAAVLGMRQEMLDYFNSVENIHLQLSFVLTLFIGMYYLQYHMSRIAAWKKTGALAP
ncbi:MAG: DUF4339 domain-containing protein [Bryobacterales bacterium]|nr:DUF4339 domain-containing protein [Bryobacterales bacterium]